MKHTKERVAEIQVSYRPAISNKPVIISALDAFVEMVENVSRLIDGDAGWIVSSTDSIRVAQILDSITNRP